MSGIEIGFIAAGVILLGLGLLLAWWGSRFPSKPSDKDYWP